MNILLSITLGFVLGIYQHSAQAGTVSDTFSTGDTLTADHLNNIKNAVNDNNDRVTANSAEISGIQPQVILVDANSEAKFRVLGMFGDSIASPIVLTNQGFKTVIRPRDGMVYWYNALIGRGLLYESSNCSGDAYAMGGAVRGAVYIAPLGRGDAAYSSGLLYYTPFNEPEVTIDANSELVFNYNDGIYECSAISTESINAYKAYPNDPNVTGIANTAYPSPMILQ